MCGIAGILNSKGETVPSHVIRRMTDVIAHRGPDGEGVYADAGIGLGHRRLAIIDLSTAGYQPMSTSDKRFVISYNGEVFNFRELRIELEACGESFKSTSDTEVVLKALARWGTSALSRFNGMFALALWDREKKELLLARDRYGIKPLYYTCVGHEFLFGSEVKALLAYPGMKATMDKEALVEYLTFQNFLTDRTLFKGVSILPPGSYMKLSVGSSIDPKPVGYWDFCFKEPAKPLREEEYLEELERLFAQAVQRQLVSDVELGAFLSGGIDSGAITAIASKHFPNLKSFTVGFDLSSASGLETAFDERRQAEHMSYLFKTEHYQMVLKAGDMERIIPKLTKHLEEPRVGQSYPNYYASLLASRFVKVVLAGAGGDELFGGYPWRYYRALGTETFDQFIDEYYAFWQRLIPNHSLPNVLSPIWKDVQHVSTRDIFRSVFVHHQNELQGIEDYINHSLYFEAKTFLHGLLIVEDKLSMANGLETRVPFLDNDLVDFAMRLPVQMKLAKRQDVMRVNENDPGKTQRYFSRTGDGKMILRKAMSKHIPEQITNGAKQGFSAPDASWFKGESIEYVKRRLLGPEARIYEFMNRDEITSLINEHLNGTQNRRLLIWSLLNLEEWCHQFL